MATLLVSVLLGVPSSALLAKYVADFSVLALVPCIFLLLRYVLARAPARSAAAGGNDVPWMVFVGAIITLLVIAFLIIYPMVNTSLPGRGSDRDDALNLAAAALLRGEYPYADWTYLGNPITTLPGAIIFALPFVVLGNSAYQALPWLLAWIWAVRRAAASRALAAAVVCVVLLSPETLRETLSGGDLLVNGIYVCLSAAWLAHQAETAPQKSGILLLAAVLFGLALASRPNFALVWPIVVACVTRSAGLRSAIPVLLGSVGAAVAVTLPVYLINPSGFSPLHVASKLVFSSIPNSATVIMAASVSLSLLLAARSHRGRMMWDCAIACYLPFLLMAAFASLDARSLDSYGLGYSLCCLPFVGLAIAARQQQPGHAPAVIGDIRRSGTIA